MFADTLLIVAISICTALFAEGMFAVWFDTLIDLCKMNFA